MEDCSNDVIASNYLALFQTPLTWILENPWGLRGESPKSPWFLEMGEQLQFALLLPTSRSNSVLENNTLIITKRPRALLIRVQKFQSHNLWVTVTNLVSPPRRSRRTDQRTYNGHKRTTNTMMYLLVHTSTKLMIPVLPLHTERKLTTVLILRTIDATRTLEPWK